MRVECNFPEIDDPKLISQALNYERLKWDNAKQSITNLEEYCNTNVLVQVILNKAVFGTSQREFIDKRIIFDDTDSEDIYMYVTHAPDPLSPLNHNYVRANALLGINKISRRKDGKSGCVFQTIS